MGLVEGVLAVVIILMVNGLLPMAMAWLEQRWLHDEEKVGETVLSPR